MPRKCSGSYRSSLDLYGVVLESCSDGAIISRVVLRSNTHYDAASKRIEYLISVGLLRSDDLRGTDKLDIGVKKYFCTEAGSEAAALIKRRSELFSNVEVGRFA